MFDHSGCESACKLKRKFLIGLPYLNFPSPNAIVQAMLKRTLLLALLSLAPFSFAEEPTTKETSKPETVAVARATVQATVTADGYFEPVDPLEIRLKPEAYAGDLKIVSIAAQGATVRAGDVVLKIDDADVQKQLAAANDEVANANAALTKTQADATLGEQTDVLAMKQSTDEFAKAEFDLKWFDDVEGKQYITRADLGVKAAKDNVDDQQDELDQLKMMYKSEELTNATADIVVKRAIRALERSQIAAKMAEETVQKTKGIDFQRARTAYADALERQKIANALLQAQQAQSKVARTVALETAKRAADKAKEKVDDLKKDLESLTVQATADGMVLYGSFARGAWANSDPRLYRVGEKVTPNQVVLTVVFPGKIRFVTDLPELQLGMIKAGLKAHVAPLSLRDAASNGTTESPNITGSLRDATQMFTVPITLERMDPRLLPGARAAVRIDAGKAENVLTLPASAVSRGQVKRLDKDGSSAWHDVVTGLSDGKIVEITQGVNEGDNVLKNPE